MLKNIAKGARYILFMDTAFIYSFFGVNAILPLFMLLTLGVKDVKIVSIMQISFSVSYLATVLTTYLAEKVINQRQLMNIACFVSCIGHIILSFSPNLTNLYVGVCLIAIGNGIIRICIQPLISYQANNDKQQISKLLSLLYIFRNIGTISIMVTPFVFNNYGYKVAFLSPTIVIFIATFIMLLGNKHIKIPALNKDTKFFSNFNEIKKIIPIILVMAVFYVFFSQIYSSWIIQGEQMNVNVFGFIISPPQMNFIDTIVIVTMVPIVNFKLLPYLNNKFNILKTIKSQLLLGVFLLFLAFCIITALQFFIDSNLKINLMWQTVPYILVGFAEIMVMCIGGNYVYSLTSHNLHVKVGLLWSITNVIINSLAASLIGIFGVIDVTFFTCCTLFLLAFLIFLKISKLNVN